jgi:hypothetical protein
MLKKKKEDFILVADGHFREAFCAHDWETDSHHCSAGSG